MILKVYARSTSQILMKK